jgi:hypothetical protein
MAWYLTLALGGWTVAGLAVGLAIGPLLARISETYGASALNAPQR